MKLIETTWTWVRALSVGLLASLIGASYLALILAECNKFTLAPCILFATLAGSTATWIAYRRVRQLPSSGKAAWILAGLMAFGSLIMTTPPSEMILGGWDPGVYIHTAASISRGGGLQIQAVDIEALTPSDREVLFRDVSGSRQPFQGMFMLSGGRLSPQFMHLYPSLMAIGYSLFGVWGALMVNPILSVIAIFMMYWFASKVVGGKWALMAAFLLAINPAQVWQAKFPTAEMLTQILLLMGFGNLIELTKQKSSVLPAILSGGLFGLAFLTRYDVVLIIAPVVLLLIATQCKPHDNRGILSFLLALSLIGVHAWIHMHFIAPCYRPLPDIVFPLFGYSVIMAFVLFMSLQTASLQRVFQGTRNRTWLLKSLFTLGFIGFLVVAWYIRPHLSVDGTIFHVTARLLSAVSKPDWITVLGGADSLNIFFLTSIFGSLTLLSGFIGILFLAWRIRENGIGIWLLSSVFVLMILVTNVFHDHFMMWVSRRFIPVVIPLLVIGITAFAREFYGQARLLSKPISAGLSAGILILSLIMTLPDTYRMASLRDWPGLCSWYDGLTQRIPADSIVYCDQPGFAAPLRFMYGLDAYEFYGSKGIMDYVKEHSQNLSQARRNMYILTTQKRRDMDTELQTVVELPLRSQIQTQPSHSIPNGVKNRGGDFLLYRMAAPTSASKITTDGSPD